MLAHQYALLTRVHTYGMEYVFFFFVWVVLAYHVLVSVLGGYLGAFVAITKCGKRGTPKGCVFALWQNHPAALWLKAHG